MSARGFVVALGLFAGAACGKFGETEASSAGDGGGQDGGIGVEAGGNSEGGARPCNALRFDGKRGHVVIADAPALDLAGTFTVEAWVRRRAGGPDKEMHILSHHDHSASEGWALLVKNDKLEVRVYGDLPGEPKIDTAGTDATGPTLLADSQWHHVAGISDGVFVRAYVDGVEVDAEDLEPNLTRAAYRGDLRVGRSAVAIDAANDFSFDGDIDEVRLATGVQALTFVVPRPPSPADVAWLRFDEAAGTRAPDEAGAHDGTLVPGLASAGATLPAWVTAPCRR